MTSQDQRSDEELVAACNDGGPREAALAFEALYRRHRDYVLRIARRFARDRELALDALQETFAYLLKKFPPAGEGLVLTARIQTLLYPVAKNSAISALRKADRYADTADVSPDEL
ncbi:MAG TPA: sigma-70 family RNA polymerase sigma factor, partial [Gammaproteobacteria bacterium]|nr:sigma-70 family RNA polymerase sigma factor [Gammaproteobacteria bacterium]